MTSRLLSTFRSYCMVHTIRYSIQNRRGLLPPNSRVMKAPVRLRGAQLERPDSLERPGVHPCSGRGVPQGIAGPARLTPPCATSSHGPCPGEGRELPHTRATGSHPPARRERRDRLRALGDLERQEITPSKSPARSEAGWSSRLLLVQKRSRR